MNTTEIYEAFNHYVMNTGSRFPVVFDHAKGATAWDKDGKKYIDMCSGYGANSLGYQDEDWLNAVIDQLHKMQHCSNLYYHEIGAIVAKKLVQRSGMQKVFFANSGGEANEAAFKVARKYGNTIADVHKNAILYMTTSFHGRSISATAATGSHPGLEKYFGPLTPGFYPVRINDIDHLKEQVAMYNPCAIIMELVQGEGGVIELDQPFVDEAVRLCHDNDILFIDDEVQTGIGRTGTFFTYEQYGFEPDIVSFAKGIGGGLPIGGILTNEKTCDVFSPGEHGTTFGMNPVACAGANVVLDTIDEVFLDEVRNKADYLRAKLLEIPEVKGLSGLGLMVGIDLKSKVNSDVVNDLVKNGVLAITAGDRVRLLPPLVISKEEIDEALEIMASVLA